MTKYRIKKVDKRKRKEEYHRYYLQRKILGLWFTEKWIYDEVSDTSDIIRLRERFFSRIKEDEILQEFEV